MCAIYCLQVFEEAGGCSESDGTPSSFSESDAEDTLVEPNGNSSFLTTDHTLMRDTPSRTQDELTVEANVGSTCSIPITSGHGTTNLTFTLPELRIQPATDDEVGSLVDMDGGTQHSEVPEEEDASIQKDTVVDKQEDVGEKQEESVDQQEEAVTGTQEAAVDRPAEDVVDKHLKEGGDGEDSLARTPSSSSRSDKAQRESLEEEVAVHTRTEGALDSSQEAGVEAIAADVPPASSLPSSTSPVDTAAQTDPPQTGPTHTPLGSPPTTSQAPTSFPDSTVLVGDVSITTILGDLTLRGDPPLPPELTPSFAHFTPGLNLTKTGITQHSGNSREFPQDSAIRGSMGEYLKPSAASSSTVTMATPAVVGSAPKPEMTAAPPTSMGGRAQLPSAPVHQPIGTAAPSATQCDRTPPTDTPLSAPSATPTSSQSYISGDKRLTSPPTSSAQLSAFLESLVAKYSPTHRSPAAAPPLGDTPYPLQQERASLPPRTPASSVSPPMDTPSLSRSLQTEFSTACRLSSSGMQTATVRSYGISPSGSAGGGSPHKNLLLPGVGGGSPLRRSLGSGMGGGSPFRQSFGSEVGGGSPLWQYLGSGTGAQLSSFRATSEKTISPRASHPGSTFSPPTVHVSPSKAVSPAKPSAQLLVGVPHSLVFPRVCCVGTSLEGKLAVASHSDRWTESKLTVAEVYHNGEKVRGGGCSEGGEGGGVVREGREGV